MSRLRRPKFLTWLMALVFLTQAMGMVCAMPAGAAPEQTSPLQGWVICTSHGTNGIPAPASGGKAEHQHDHTCFMCGAGCPSLAALPTGTVGLPLPTEIGRIAQPMASNATPSTPPQVPPNARAPPLSA